MIKIVKNTGENMTYIWQSGRRKLTVLSRVIRCLRKPEQTSKALLGIYNTAKLAKTTTIFHNEHWPTHGSFTTHFPHHAGYFWLPTRTALIKRPIHLPPKWSLAFTSTHPCRLPTLILTTALAPIPLSLWPSLTAMATLPLHLQASHYVYHIPVYTLSHSQPTIGMVNKI